MEKRTSEDRNREMLAALKDINDGLQMLVAANMNILMSTDKIQRAHKALTAILREMV